MVLADVSSFGSPGFWDLFVSWRCVEGIVRYLFADDDVHHFDSFIHCDGGGDDNDD